jgi:hypothetical protein
VEVKLRLTLDVEALVSAEFGSRAELEAWLKTDDGRKGVVAGVLGLFNENDGFEDVGWLDENRQVYVESPLLRVDLHAVPGEAEIMEAA